MENDWINSKDKITLALPPNATPLIVILVIIWEVMPIQYAEI